jgi:hypothetical protein
MTDTTYSSTVNTFVNAVLGESLSGAFDDASGYSSVRVWVNAPGNCNLNIFYSDNITGANYIYDSYPVYGNNVSSVSSLKKKRYVKVQLLNVIPTVQQTGVLMRTKFVSSSIHPFLNYSTDDVTVNLTAVIEDLKFTSVMDHSGSSLQLYGRTDPTDATATADKLAHRPIRTDVSGNVSVDSLNAAGIAVKPGNNAVFNVAAGIDGCTISATADGLIVKSGATPFPITGDIEGCTISSTENGLAINPGTTPFPVTGGAGGCTISSTVNGLAVKPGAVDLPISGGVGGCTISSTANGLAINPGVTPFPVSGGVGGCTISSTNGLAVKPGAIDLPISGGVGGCTISSAELNGLAINPGVTPFPVTGGVGGCTISSAELNGLTVKPGTGEIFNISSSQNGLDVSPATGLVTQSGILTNANVRIGTTSVKTLVSLNLSPNPLNPLNRVFVFGSNIPAFAPNTPDADNAIFSYEIKGEPRELIFQYGVNIGTDLYLRASTIYNPIVPLAENETLPVIGDADSIFYTATYVPSV